MPEDVSLATLLHRHRRAASMTLEELADRSGVSTRAISDMERGRTRAPQQRTLQSLVDALGIAPLDRSAMLAAAAAVSERRVPWVSGFCEPPRGVADFTARDNRSRHVTCGNDEGGEPGPGRTQGRTAAAAARRLTIREAQ